MASYIIHIEEVLGATELQSLLQDISDNDKQALRDVKIVQSPREGRFTVIWERKV